MSIAPKLLLNEDICRANIRRMADKARKNSLRFKPHMKTHQSAEIGQWLREAGAEGITVSNINMARYFSNAGWKDITLAFPAYPAQCTAINNLAENADLSLLVNNSTAVEKLKDTLTHSVKVYIEIDTGSNRTGLTVNQKPEIDKLINTIRDVKKLKWTGFYSHPGHSYQAKNISAVQNIQLSVIKQFQKLRTAFEPSRETIEVCVGDTPCCSISDTFHGIDAISPGNFVFYDLMQYHIGSCGLSDIAVAVECPIIEIVPRRDEYAIHGGAVHFSKERITNNDRSHFGLIAVEQNGHWEPQSPPAYLKALSQEHGLVKHRPDGTDKYTIGDTVLVLPVHSCLTANLMRRYTLTDGTTQLDQMPLLLN